MITYQLESSLDYALGTLLKFEEPYFNTASDLFDFSLGLVAITCLVVLPLVEIILLCNNLKRMDNRPFKLKWGQFYDGYKTYTVKQRKTSVKMLFWFLFRRILTALNLVELRNQTIWVQFSLNMWLCLIDIWLMLHWTPYDSRLRGVMEKVNGFTVLFLSQLVIMQSDLIPS